ncbi:MAG: DnaA ATPase domain-containing protein [Planctomycetota bacterium]
MVLIGPPHSGKRTLADFACHLGQPKVFRVDPLRLRGGSSFVPRKPLVVVDGIDRIAKQHGAQRRLACIIDEIRDRGDRMLVTMQEHPARVKGMHEALQSRLAGGIVVQLPPPDRATRRLRLRSEARRLGQRLPSSVEDELVELPPEVGIDTLRHRIGSGSMRTGDLPPPALERMKDTAARLFHVERALLDEPVKRRSVVEARRAIMAAAVEEGVPVPEITRSFKVSAARTVREACSWARRKSEKDDRFAALVRELGRVASGR